MGIVAFSVGSYLVWVTACLDGSIKDYHPVIPYLIPSTLTMPRVNIARMERLSVWRVSAVDYDFVYLSHDRNVSLYLARAMSSMQSPTRSWMTNSEPITILFSMTHSYSSVT